MAWAYSRLVSRLSLPEEEVAQPSWQAERMRRS
jgi:hypothetical protein